MTRRRWHKANTLYPTLLLLLLLLVSGCTEPTVPPTASPRAEVHLTVAAISAEQGYLRPWALSYRREQEVVVNLLPTSANEAEEALAQARVDLALFDQAPLASYQGVLTVTVVGHEPIAVIVHPENPLRDLAAETIVELCSGRIMDWSQVGGANRPVQLYLQPDTAGEVAAFQALSQQHLAPQAILRTSPASLVTAVSQDEGGLAILPASQVTDQVVALRVNGVLPNEPEYPWQLALFLAYGPASSEQAHDFIRFVQETAPQP